MGAISSVNFKKSNAVQTRHNDRDLPPNYLIGGEVECNRKHQEALALKNQMIKNAIETYNNNKSAKAPSFKAKSYEWSAVVNIKETTSMNDLENLSKHFQEKYGFQCYQIAIHRDEGHINEQGEKVINHHAHMEFITLDKNIGKNNFRREKITPKVLRQIQTEVAEILGMERGEDKRISKRERIEPRKYAKIKEEQKKEIKSIKEELLSTKEIKARLEQERKAWIEEKNHTAQEYKQLREIAKNQFEKIEDLENAIKTLRIELEKEKLKNKNLKEEVKNRDTFISNLGNLLNFRDLNYNTPINELECYLNAKTIKNDRNINQEQENASKREKELLYEQNKLNLINANNMKNDDYYFLQDFYKIHSKDKELQEQPSLKVYQEPFKQMPDIISRNLWGDHPSILKDEAPLQTAKNYLKTLLDYLKNLTINKELKQETKLKKNAECSKNKALNFEKKERKISRF